MHRGREFKMIVVRAHERIKKIQKNGYVQEWPPKIMCKLNSETKEKTRYKTHGCFQAWPAIPNP